MMNERQTELARRLVADGMMWRWMPGMVATITNDGHTVRIVGDECGAASGFYMGKVDPPESGHADGWVRAWGLAQWREYGYLPDLDDPATVGCLLAMLWEVWPGAMVITGKHGDFGIRRGRESYEIGFWSQSPGEAIAAALLSAWGTP